MAGRIFCDLALRVREVEGGLPILVVVSDGLRHQIAGVGIRAECAAGNQTYDGDRSHSLHARLGSTIGTKAASPAACDLNSHYYLIESPTDTSLIRLSTPGGTIHCAGVRMSGGTS